MPPWDEASRRRGGRVRVDGTRAEHSGHGWTRVVGHHSGIINCRDLGGLRTKYDDWTRYGLFYRSGEVRAHAADAVSALGIATQLDLRTERERARNAEGVGYCRPFAVVEQNVDVGDGAFLGPGEGGNPSDFIAAYVRMLPSAALAAAAVLEVLADPARCPLLVSCTWGKDRTGVVVALVLDTLGVHSSDIARDYALSARDLRLRCTELWSQSMHKGIDRSLLARRLETNESTMSALLRHVRQEFDSAEELLRAVASTRLDIEAARRALVPDTVALRCDTSEERSDHGLLELRHAQNPAQTSQSRP